MRNFPVFYELAIVFFFCFIRFARQYFFDIFVAIEIYFEVPEFFCLRKMLQIIGQILSLYLHNKLMYVKISHTKKE